MNKRTLLITLLIALASLTFADACDGVAVFRIWNDPVYHGLDACPEASTDVITVCPPDLYLSDPDDTLEQVFFPDTLLWPDSIAWRIESDTAYSGDIDGEGYFNSAGVSTPVHYPPEFEPECCVLGIYAKARMWDAATDEYSPWVDVNTTDMFYCSYNPPYGYFMQISLCNFKTRDLSGSMGFNCNSDSLILYVWDCNDDDISGSSGEFAVWFGTFHDADSLESNTIILKHYSVTPGIGESDALPKEYSLAHNTPNPFNASTSIEYSLPEDAQVSITISNILGEKVRTLVDCHESAGVKRVVWDGADDAGEIVPGGVYFYSIKANDFSAKRRMVMVK